MIEFGSVTFRANPKLERDLGSHVDGLLEKAGQKVETEAKRLCPVLTGNLRRSITHRVEDHTGIVAATANYAYFVEFGTSRMSPRPFLRPALGILRGGLG